MASLMKQLMGIAPTAEKNGQGYIPSPLGRLLGVDSRSGYKPTTFSSKYEGSRRVLVLCTQERYLEMVNGKKFSTGHNVQETAVPLMHLCEAGFEFDVVTPTGAPAILEDWSVPKKDAAVLGFMKTYEAKFQNPLSLAKLIADDQLNAASPYIALFLPGGHGAMVGLPDDAHVGALIRWIHDSDRYLVVVCHGPAALMAAAKDGAGPHPYSGYELCAFPDSVDKQSPMLGYLPGQLPWFQCELLEQQGLRIVNSRVDGSTHVDRKLYSGDSPKACDQLGRLVAAALLNDEAR